MSGRKYLRLGAFHVSSYAAMLYVGFVLGVWLGARISHLDATRFAASSVILLIPALLGGRLWYLAQHLRSHPDRIGFRSGGAGLYGGLVLAFATSWPVLRTLGLPFWRYWDGAAVVLLAGMAVTRLGCLMTGCCAGRETNGLLGVWLPDDRGVWRRRYPTQVMEALWSAAILTVGAALYDSSDPAGVLFFGSAAAYGFGRIGLELLRADAEFRRRSTQMNLAFSIALVAISLTGMRVCAR